MSSGIELHDSRVSHLDMTDGIVTIHFSHVYIHKSKGRPGQAQGTGWSQEARLILSDAAISGPMPTLPNTISEGFVEVGGVRHERLPLPFKRRVEAKVWLAFLDGTSTTITGKRPFIELLGKPIYLEDFP